MIHLTKDQITAIFGRDVLDDQTIATIIETGASEQELMEAYNLFVRGSELEAERRHPPSPMAAEICELLNEITDLQLEERVRSQ